MDEGKAIGAVAAFEALKGAAVLVAASGLLLLVHQDLQAVAERLVAHAHLNPAARYPRIFINAANELQNAHLTLLALGAAGYAAMRFVEAYGLFRRAAWAEVLAAVSGAIYVPLEAGSIWRHFTWIGVGSLCLNLAVVGVMVAALLRRRRRAADDSA